MERQKQKSFEKKIHSACNPYLSLLSLTLPLTHISMRILWSKYCRRRQNQHRISLESFFLVGLVLYCETDMADKLGLPFKLSEYERSMDESSSLPQVVDRLPSDFQMHYPLRLAAIVPLLQLDFRPVQLVEDCRRHHFSAPYDLHSTSVRAPY